MSTLETSALNIERAERSPEVNFDYENGHLKIIGESYPEDVTSFYGPVLDSLSRYLERLGEGSCRFELSLIYFNSASAKVIMSILELLDEAAENGATIDLYWYFDPEDDTMEELGEEFGEDMEHANFHLEAMSADGN